MKVSLVNIFDYTIKSGNANSKKRHLKPVCQFIPRLNFSLEEITVISTLITNLLELVMEKEPDYFVSEVFTHPPKDGAYK